MIRTFTPGDLDAVSSLWLEANQQAHDFIPAEYWEGQLKAVRQALPQAELYVWDEDGAPLGFVGLTGSYIAGIFVRPEEQSNGIGKHLLDRAKAARDRLTLHVYQKNARAAAFYRREGFAVQKEQTDEATGETEYQMVWERQNREENLC